MIERLAFWEIFIKGRTVTRCSVDYALSVELWTPDELFTVRIEGAFLFRTADQTVHLSPGEATALGPVLAILHKQVKQAFAYKSGNLEVRFSDGSSLFVEPDAQFEAWEVINSRGLRIVCLPGGALAIWRPT